MSRISNRAEYDYAVHFTRNILRFLGAWPMSRDTTFFEKITSVVQICTCYFLILFLLVPPFLRLVLKHNSSSVIITTVGQMCNSGTGLLNYSVILYRAEEIRALLKEIKNDWQEAGKTENRDIMLAKAKIGRLLVLSFAIFIYGSGLSYRTVLVVSMLKASRNTTMRIHSSPSYFIFFDEKLSPYYEIVLTIQLISGVITYSLNSGVCGLAALFIMHLCGQLRILINHIKSLGEGDEVGETVAGERIAIIVESQIKARSFLENVHKIMQDICLANVLNCTSLACLIAYRVLEVWEHRNAASLSIHFLLASSFAFSVFIFNYIGQMLDNETIEVGLTATTLNWYHLPVKKSKSLVMIIAMSNYPMKFTAGKMMHMSLTTFTSLMKTVFGYLNIMRSVLM